MEKNVKLSVLSQTPVAGYLLHQWLQNFATRIDLAWWIFAAAAFLAVFIAVLTVGYQSIRAGLMSPVDSLRSE